MKIAFQRFGAGPVDLVYMPYFLFNIDLFWDFGPIASWLEGLAEFSRVLIHDPRGTGLSDRDVEPGDVTGRADDLLAVLDAAGVERATIFGSLSAGAVGAVLGATRPDRISHLVWWHARAREAWAPDYPWGDDPEQIEEESLNVESVWGSSEDAHEHASSQGPMGGVDTSFQSWMGKMYRNSVTPARAETLLRKWFAIDVRDVLPSVRVPTLVLARESTSQESEAVSRMIPAARFEVLGGSDHMPWFGDTESVLTAVRGFLGVDRRTATRRRFVSTVLFTDIVDSTGRAAATGDEAWRPVVAEHHRLVRGLLERYGGVEMDTAGDGFFAAFDAPSDAVRCAVEAVRAARTLGIEIRAGVHTGEVYESDDKHSGLAVAIGARVCGLAGASEVMVSSTVKDLSAGSGLAFEDAGEHELKGVPDRWRLYRVVG